MVLTALAYRGQSAGGVTSSSKATSLPQNIASGTRALQLYWVYDEVAAGIQGVRSQVHLQGDSSADGGVRYGDKERKRISKEKG